MLSQLNPNIHQEQAFQNINKIHSYEDKQIFKYKFFTKNNYQPDPQNFHQYFYINNIMQIRKQKENNQQKQNQKEAEYETIIDKIVYYIFEYQQSNINKNKKYIYNKKRVTEELFLKNDHQMKEEIDSTISKCSSEVQESDLAEQFQFQDILIQYLQLSFDNFFKGENSQILFQDYGINRQNIIISLNRALNQFNSLNTAKQKKDNLKVTFIGINQEYNFEILNKEQDYQYLQSFSFMIQNQSYQSEKKKDYYQNISHLIKQDQYCINVNIHNNKITNQIQLLYRYFFKNKIKQFQPKLIVLFLEINDSFEFDSFYFQKLITQLEKISQQSLIVIPVLTQDTSSNYEKYLKKTILITNSFLDYSYKRKNKAYYYCDEMSAQQYKEYSNYFAQTLKEQQFYDRQYTALKVRNIQLNDLDSQKENQKNKFSILEKNIQQEQEFQFNLIGILNQKNEIILTKLYEKSSLKPIKIQEVQHFIQYYSDKFIICIVQNNQLFYSICNYNQKSDKQIEDSIYLIECVKFKQYNMDQKQKISYLLQDSYFYQFQILISFDLKKKNIGNYTGFYYNVKMVKYDLNCSDCPKIYVYNQDSTLDYKGSLINFTITQLTENKFIILGGSLKSVMDSDYNLRSCSLMIEIVNDNQLQVKENSGKQKSYENAFIQKISDSSLLFFEAQTRYLAAPVQSQIQRLSIFGAYNSLKLEDCQILNDGNFEFYQKKKKLFKSNQLNSKVSLTNKNKLAFIVIVQELVYDNLEVKDQEDSINLKILSKQSQLQTHKFQFTFDLIKQTIDIEVKTQQDLIEQMQKPNKLRDSCRYFNWLEDRHNQYIFNYNGNQNLYLLHFNDNPRPKTRKFIFEDPKDLEDQKDLEEYIDYDEVILNDLENEQLWIVRKINYQNQISLDLFESDWINLQDVKDSQDDSITKVPIFFLLTVEKFQEDFCLIGLEVKWQLEQGKRCPYLIICTSTVIYEISIQMIRKIKWDNILRYKINTLEKEPLIFYESPIQSRKEVKIQVNTQIPTIVASLENGDLLLFYSYCNINQINQNQYELEIQYQILKNKNQKNNDELEMEDNCNREFQIKALEYYSQKQVNLAKINTVIIKNNEFEFSVIVEESDSRLYKIFSNQTQQKKKKYITNMKDSKILNDAAPQKNQSLITNKHSDQVHKVE